jgi:hypothetical protein
MCFFRKGVYVRVFVIFQQMQLGDILFSLGYLRIAGRLTLIVMKARNLPQASVKGTGMKRTF